MAKVLIGNFKGKQGDQGIQGEEGKAASIMIDSVQTLQPEENATVENVGTTSDARLKFGIPRGADGMTDFVARHEDASEYTATPTADAPIVINDLNGKTQQNSTNGYQLFDASKIQTKTQGGATVTKNDDGSFTISGSGLLSDNFSNLYNLSKEESLKIIKAGKISLNEKQGLIPELRFGIRNASTNTFVSGKCFTNTLFSFNITEDDITSIENGTNIISFGFFSSSQREIKPGTIKPMVYQEGNGEWEEYTGGQPSPSIEYNQDITGVGEDGKIEIICKTAQLFDASKVPTKSQGGADVTNNNDGSFTISGSGNLSESFSYMASFTKEEALKILKVGKLYVSNDVLNKIPRFYFGIRSGSTYQEGKYVSGFSKEAEITAEDLKKIESGEYNLACGFYSSQNSTITPGTVKPMVYQNGEGTWQPFRSTSIQIPLDNPLYDGDKICYVKPGESYINSEGDTVVADRMLYGVHRENAVIKSYNSEEIPGEYKSSAGELTTGAEVVYKLAQPYFKPFEDQTPFYNLRSFDDLTYIYSDDSLNPILTVDVAKNQTGGYLLESYAQAQKNAISEASSQSRLSAIEQQLVNQATAPTE